MAKVITVVVILKVLEKHIMEVLFIPFIIMKLILDTYMHRISFNAYW